MAKLLWLMLSSGLALGAELKWSQDNGIDSTTLLAAAGAFSEDLVQPLPGARPCKRLLIGTHHKSGTVFTRKFFTEVCGGNMDRLTGHQVPSPGRCIQRSCLWNHINASGVPRGLPLIHFIRDPLELIVSGYQYHLVTTEKWALTSGLQQKLRAAPNVTEALRLQYNSNSAYAIQIMIEVYKLTHNVQTTFTVRLDDLTRNFWSYHVITQSMQRWIGIDHPKPYNMFFVPNRRLRHAPGTSTNRQVDNFKPQVPAARADRGSWDSRRQNLRKPDRDTTKVHHFQAAEPTSPSKVKKKKKKTKKKKKKGRERPSTVHVSSSSEKPMLRLAAMQILRDDINRARAMLDFPVERAKTWN